MKARKSGAMLSLDAYYDAMASDEEPAKKAESAEGYKVLSAAIRAGNPGLGKFNPFTLHDEWKNLPIESEQYGSSICRYDITVGDLVQGDLDYNTRTASYSAEISYKNSQRYEYTIGVVANGYKYARMSDWTDLPDTWPEKSASKVKNGVYNVNGALVYENSFEYYNAFAAVKNGVKIYDWVDDEEGYEIRLYDLKFNIVDENGKECVKGKRHLLGDKTEYYDEIGRVIDRKEKITFTKITPDVMDLIDNGKAFVNLTNCYLEYGKYNNSDDYGGSSFKRNFPELEIPLKKIVFICQNNNWNNKNDNQYEKVLSSYYYNKNIPASLPSEFVEVQMDGKKLFVQKTETTQDLYEIVMGVNPSEFKGGNNPVENVTWYDAIYFCNMLSISTGLTPVYAVDGEISPVKWKSTCYDYDDSGEKVFYNYSLHKGESLRGTITQNENADGYRLPTQEEWLYAAKGGEEFTYAGSDNADEVAWYKANSDEKTHEVAQKKPNGYGLYDMSGNVSEWCWDTESASGSDRVVRGGSWHANASVGPVTMRFFLLFSRCSYLGFRVCRSSSN